MTAARVRQAKKLHYGSGVGGGIDLVSRDFLHAGRKNIESKKKKSFLSTRDRLCRVLQGGINLRGHFDALDGDLVDSQLRSPCD